MYFWRECVWGCKPGFNTNQYITMKQPVLLIFILLSVGVSAQQKAVIGILTGGNIPGLSHTNFDYKFVTGISAGAETQLRLVSGLYGSVRTEYQAQTIHFRSNNPFFPASQTMHLGNLQLGLQWKKSWWYAGTGIYGQMMLKKFLEAEVGAICDCIGPTFFPPVYTQRNYGGLGYYFQSGATPRLSEKWSLLIETNVYSKIPGSFSEQWYQKRRFMPGARLGLQRKL